ncbi:hypothetical protein [uncultured Lactobacillus sp.]|uniref:hypothetical protein n=1 Tax=uncultured Lactobacillus sp. TaxID=153152 RepID=UPI00261F4D0C|nr:hypothetical protein [uncultured Lactobacillus sp.]
MDSKDINEWADMLANLLLPEDKIEEFKQFAETAQQVRKLSRKQKLELLNIIATDDDISVNDLLDAIENSVNTTNTINKFEKEFKEESGNIGLRGKKNDEE